MPERDAPPRLELLPARVGAGATITGESAYTRRNDGFIVGATQRNIGGGTPTWTVKVQHSPDGAEVTDANAYWIDLVTLTVVSGNAAQASAHTTRHFERLRAIATYGGTGTGDIEVSIQ